MITEEVIKPFNPTAAVIVYSRNSDYYLETHEIQKSDAGFQWGEGKPFAKEQLKKLSTALSGNSFTPLKIKGIMPANVLTIQQNYFDTTFAWYIEPGVRELHFDKKLKINTGKVKLPGLIFLIHKNSFYVVAFKGTAKPTANTELYKAPFFNIYEGGEVCMGNIKDSKRKAYLHEEIERWEGRFFNSNFSHFLDEEVVAKKYNLSLLFKALMVNKKSFPEEALLPAEFKTVESFITQITK